MIVDLDDFEVLDKDSESVNLVEIYKKHQKFSEIINGVSIDTLRSQGFLDEGDEEESIRKLYHHALDSTNHLFRKVLKQMSS